MNTSDNVNEPARISGIHDRDDPKAADELMPQVYEELRRLAAQKLSREKPGQTLQATALVHEAWLRLVSDEEWSWNDSRHFFYAAAEAMRRILVENARRKQCFKHGGQLHRVDADELDLASPLPDDQLLAVDDALDRLATINARAADVVKLRFFGGLTEAQVAEHQGVSVATVERLWAFARAWLFNEIRQGEKISSSVRENAPENRD
jgi:RNA polymerase sigma factor (TIGR02999 family)